MRIGVFLGDQTDESGGAFTFQDAIVRTIESRDLEHDIVYLSYGTVRSRFGNPRSRYVQLKRRSQPKSSWTKTASLMGQTRDRHYLLEQAVEQEGLDIVWFVSQDIDQVYCPFIYTVWDLQHRAQPWFPEVSLPPHDFAARESHKDSIRRATLVIVPNSTSAQELKQFYGVPEGRVLQAHHPTPEFVYRVSAVNEKVPKTDRPYLLYPAQFWAHKNHRVLIEALKILDRNSSVRFDVVFTGADKGNQWWILDRVVAAGLRDRFHFLGFVSQAELIGLYHNAFALVYPTFFGPENLPPLEAMACGLPAIVSDVPGAKDQYGDAALFFPPTSEEDLAAQVIKLWNEPHLRKNLIVAGERLAKERSSEAYVSAVMSFCERFARVRRCWYQK